MESNVEILVKSFLRPSCVERLVRSIRRYYPKITIRVCDDGNLDYLHDVILHKLPFYSGLSVGRNFLLSKVETPYFVMCDDDWVFTKDTKLEKLYAVISAFDDVGIVGGMIQLPDGNLREGFGHLEVTYSEKEGRKLTRYYYGNKATSVSIKGVKCYPCRMTSNFFMGNTQLFRDFNVHWRDELKRNEHLPFFLDFPPLLKIFAVPEVSIRHEHRTNKRYQKYKDNNLYWRMVCERKIVFKRLYE